MIRLARAVAEGTGQPERTFSALEEIVRETIGVRLFTVMEFSPERRTGLRSYTNMPDAYPASGEKPIPGNRWSELVLDRRQTFVANRIEEIASVFPDHELIRSLGCESCLNLPVTIAGEVRGTLNCLHVAGHYTPERVEAAETLKPWAALALLLAESVRRGGPAGSGGGEPKGG